MTILVTGGAGFIGRWVVQKLLNQYDVIALDNLSNGQEKNIAPFIGKPNFQFIKADVLDKETLNKAFEDVDMCIHLAAQINVQESLDHPERAFENNVVGTCNVLEACRRTDAKLVLAGTCMVYDLALSRPINEKDSIKPRSPYAGSKAAAEEMTLSYYYGYNLPVTIVRPFNTYGPYQKSNMEGGVVNIFIKKYLDGEDILVFGDGEQTRDLLYVEDCADFIIKAAFCKDAVGEVINGGTGSDIRIKDLALLICNDPSRIKYIPHHHPQSEIRKLVCDYSKAERLLSWKPETSLKDGIKRTIDWMRS
jgi:dTDP-glucose 4,6-dehydratase